MPAVAEIDPRLKGLCEDEIEAIRRRIRGRRAVRRSFESFFRLCPPNGDYKYGRHTLEMLGELKNVTKRLEAGQSSYVIINIPFRQGKSDVASRRWPVWHLGRNPDHEIILASYNDRLATDMSYAARAALREYGGWLGVRLAEDRASMDRWCIADHRGALYATGIGGTITGRGAHVLLIDDYLKNREAAESALLRDKTWDCFTHDLLTRLAPVHAVVIVATRWHEDDLVGRIIRRNDPESREYNPKFPKYKILRFPAWDEEHGWLFTERFPASWYESQRASLAEYGWNSEMQQDPKPRAGNLLKVDKAVFLPSREFDEMSAGLTFRRGWDLASTAKERTKNDPDFTVGTLAAYSDGRLFVGDRVKGQWGAGKRDEVIKATALSDNPGVVQVVEVVAAYKDACEHVTSMLVGRRIVEAFHPQTDKVARASCLEASFEAGLVYVRQAEWNADWKDALRPFPGGRHDDDADSLVTAVYDEIEGKNDYSVG